MNTPVTGSSGSRSAADSSSAAARQLDGAAARLGGQGIAGWPAASRPEWSEPALSDGRVWPAESDGTAAATVTLSWSDPLRPDDDRAGYVHRPAVDRASAAQP